MDAFVYGVVSPDAGGLCVGVGVRGVSEPDELTKESAASLRTKLSRKHQG